MAKEERQFSPELSKDFTRELGRAVTCLHRSRSKFMGERLREHGFSGAMYMILLHVDRHPGASQDSIANHMYIDKCNVARRTWKSWVISGGRQTRPTGVRTISI